MGFSTDTVGGSPLILQWFSIGNVGGLEGFSLHGFSPPIFLGLPTDTVGGSLLPLMEFSIVVEVFHLTSGSPLTPLGLSTESFGIVHPETVRGFP